MSDDYGVDLDELLGDTMTERPAYSVPPPVHKIAPATPTEKKEFEEKPEKPEKEQRFVKKKKLFIDELAYYKALRHVDTFILSKTISDLIMSKNKQSAKVMVVGETGAGKSYAALSLAEDTAKWNSLHDYGDLDHAEEYFTPERNIAVINPKDIQDLLLGATKRHGIYVIDDAAYGWNARNWHTKQSEIFSAWFGMMRTYETCLILTVQSDKFIDKQARALFNFYVEMTGPHLFEYEANFGKVFLTSLQPRSNKPVHTYYPKRNHGHDQYVLCGFISPTAQTAYEYDITRDKALTEFNSKSGDIIAKWVEKKEKGPTSARETKKDMAFRFLDEAEENGREISAKALAAGVPSIGYGTAKCYLSEWRASKQ